MSTDRRTFLRLLSTAALSATFPASISRALAIPANNRTGTIKDVEHIIFMMQENRSFDHYFGTLQGVRGYGDPRPIPLPNGSPAFYQPNGDGYLLPFHPGAPNLGLVFIEDLIHDWTSTHLAWNAGKHDQWVPKKGTTTMAHLQRSDIPFHYALADAFTICDAYHCSLLGETNPNRYYMWTGWVGNDGGGGGPVIDNAERGYSWSTYPELLQNAGITWKVYQDIGKGLTQAELWGWTPGQPLIGNYGDNALLYFTQYQNAQTGTPLANGAKTGTHVLASGTLFDEFRDDVSSGKLPQVSWIAAPEGYTEHPSWPANYGAWYVSQMLDILTDNPDVFSKTVFIICYDENDGFFDHMPPITAPVSPTSGVSTVDTANELFQGSSHYPTTLYPVGPYGMGIRIPLIAVSPWSKGGWVNSQVFDHTSLIRFIETRFGDEHPGIMENNITPWRRAVAGDLTSVFNFKSPNDGRVQLPSTVAYKPPNDTQHNYIPTPPTVQALPQQESGIRPARAVPYVCSVSGEVVAGQNAFQIQFSNHGTYTAVYQVYAGKGEFAPRTYTVSPNAKVSDGWAYGTMSQYHLLVFGPNGFYRVFKGSFGAGAADLQTQISYDIADNGIHLQVANLGLALTQVHLFDYYTQQTIQTPLEPNQILTEFLLLEQFFGWYDITIAAETDPTFQRRLAGHLETGQDSMTDPAFGSSLSQPAA